MRELDAQKHVVDAVEAEGGYALKMSHRFLIGIPDLLVKLPGRPAMILEAKVHECMVYRPDSEFKLEATALQERELRMMEGAGLITGILSFVSLQKRGIRGLYMEVYRNLGKPQMVRMVDHNYVGDPQHRQDNTINTLRAYADLRSK